MVENFVLTLGQMDAEGATDAATAILYRWTGVENVDPLGRGAVDGRHVALVEKITGQHYPATLSLETGFGAGVQSYYGDFFSGYLSRLVGQSWGSSLALHIADDPRSIDSDAVRRDPSLILSYDALLNSRTAIHDVAGAIVLIGKVLSAENPSISKQSVEDLVIPLMRVMIIDRLGSLGTSFGKIALEALGTASEHAESYGTGLAAILSMGTSKGSEVGDTIVSPHGIAFIDAGAGDDNISVGLNNALVIGGAGNDTIMGGEGSDALFGGTGADVIGGDFGDDLVAGESGDDTLRGGRGHDVIDGGAGSDISSGDSGDDVYLFNLGDGHDLIRESSGFGGWGGQDTIVLGAGIVVNQVTVTQADSGRDLVLTLSDGSTITLKTTITSVENRVEQVAFADGSVWNHAELMTRATAPTSGNDIFYGSYDGETLTSGAGDDGLYAREGNDTLVGGTGNDTLAGDGGDDVFVYALGDGSDTIRDASTSWGGGNDTIQLGTGILTTQVKVAQADGGRDLVLTFADGGSITIKAGITNIENRIEQIAFADGSVWSSAELMSKATAFTSGNDVFYGSFDGETLASGAGDDTIYAREGNDTLVGGTGNDTLSGDGGNDSYVYALGDGNDTIRDAGVSWGGGNDSIQLGAGILASQVTVTQTNGGRDLVLTFVDGGDIAIKEAVTGTENRIEQVVFLEGTVWNHAELLQRSVGATSGSDVIYGSISSEILASGAGDDTVYAREGDDTLVGGTGNDTLSGDGGNDSYVYALGDGNDTIRDAGVSWGGGNDSVQLGAGILASQVTVAQADTGRDLVLTFAGGGSITLKTTITHNENRIEQVLFADGTVWSHAELMTRSTAPNTGNDVFYGSFDGETLASGAGDDTVYAREGNDTLVGGTGNDTLSGDGGNDSYVYELGDGNDTIRDAGTGWGGGNDTIQLGAGILASQVTVAQADTGRDLVLTFAGGGSITLKTTITHNENRIEQVLFADGTVWSHAELMTFTNPPPTAAMYAGDALGF